MRGTVRVRVRVSHTCGCQKHTTAFVNCTVNCTVNRTMYRTVNCTYFELNRSMNYCESYCPGAMFGAALAAGRARFRSICIVLTVVYPLSHVTVIIVITHALTAC